MINRLRSASRLSTGLVALAIVLIIAISRVSISKATGIDVNSYDVMVLENVNSQFEKIENLVEKGEDPSVVLNDLVTVLPHIIEEQIAYNKHSDGDVIIYQELNKIHEKAKKLQEYLNSLYGGSYHLINDSEFEAIVR